MIGITLALSLYLYLFLFRSLGLSKGTYLSPAGSKCIPCSAGSWAPVGATSCVACGPGKYSKVEESGTEADCDSCTTGKYQHLSGQQSCKNCPAGKASAKLGATNQTVCETCGAGYAAAKGSPACVGCVLGEYATMSVGDTGAGVESQVLSGAKVCKACPPGYYSDFKSVFARWMCQTCVAGKYSDAGETSCTACLAGTVAAVSASAACAACATGKSQGLAAQAECNVCEAGKEAPRTGMSACDDCLAGKYALAGADVCEDCEAGTYNTKPALGYCNDCLEDTFSQPGSTVCDECSVGYYFSKDDQTCQECPQPGTTCVEGKVQQNELPISPGYWRISETTTVVHPCPKPGACSGGAAYTDNSDGYCAEGSTGVLCDTCIPDEWYFDYDTGRCEQCTEDNGDMSKVCARAQMIDLLCPLVCFCFIMKIKVNTKKQNNTE